MTRLEEYIKTLERSNLAGLNSRINFSGLGLLDNGQLQAFWRDGVLVIDNALSPKIIAEANAACDRLDALVAEETRSYDDVNLEAEQGGWNSQDESLPCYIGQIRKVKNLMDHSNSFQAVAAEPNILRAIYAILGSNFEFHSKGFLMNKPTKVSTEKPWHQDSAYFPKDAGDIITVWIPLQYVNEKNGCLYVIPSSHKLGPIQHIGQEAHIKLDEILSARAVPLQMQVGSVALFHKDILHYSGVNRTTSPRRALLFRYQSTQIVNVANYDNAFRLLEALESSVDRLDGTESSRVVELSDRLKNLKQKVNSKLLNPGALGGGVSIELREGGYEGSIEKTHLIINRVLREQAIKDGVRYIDLGTDYHYPFYDKFTPTLMALESLGQNAAASLHYPSSYGLIGLRESFRQFMKKQFGIELELNKEIMVNTGASQTFDALSRAFSGKYVLVPELSLPTVSTIARGNGAEILRLPKADGSDLVDLVQAEHLMKSLSIDSVRFLYFNSPCNPTGEVASRDYLQKLVDFARRHNLLLVHDMDSWYTTHQDGVKLENILQISGARETAITIISLSKEFGLPGLRVGLVAGNEYAIDVIREHNSVFSVMIPEVCQYAAKTALDFFTPDDKRIDINKNITAILRRSVEGWKNLGWPEAAIKFPTAGYKYLVEVPPNIEEQDGVPAGALFDYFVAKSAFVKLSNSRSFNPVNDRFIRMIIMQDMDSIDETFRRLRNIGVSYGMRLPGSIGQEYQAFIKTNIRSGF